MFVLERWLTRSADCLSDAAVAFNGEKKTEGRKESKQVVIVLPLLASEIDVKNETRNNEIIFCHKVAAYRIKNLICRDQPFRNSAIVRPRPECTEIL